MNPAGSGADERFPVDFLRRMSAMLAAGRVELPSFPQVVIQVQEVLKNPNYTAPMIARPIAAEPTLAARLLNMANSTAFNATGRVIIDLGVALTRLGSQKVYSVVLAHAIREITRTESMRSIAPRLEDLWSDCVAVAHFSDAVAKRTKLHLQDAFAAGLLHQIGHFYILVQCVEQALPRPPIVLRSDLVQEWHPRIGKAVLENWHISQAVCEAVGAQADVDTGSAGAPTLTDVLVAGVRLARRLSNAHDTTSLSSGGVLARLNLSMEACQNLIAEADPEVRALERAMRR